MLLKLDPRTSECGEALIEHLCLRVEIGDDLLMPINFVIKSEWLMEQPMKKGSAIRRGFKGTSEVS